MNLKNILKIIGIILVFVILQSYFINPDNLVNIIDKWKDYFMTIIMSIFIAILLEPIVKYLKKKSKINDILAISLSIAFVVLIFAILSLIVIPEIISGTIIKNKMVNINITKIIDKLIANISFILTFFFKYLTIGSKRIAINIDIIIVIK